jgi:hypothetical protein
MSAQHAGPLHQHFSQLLLMTYLEGMAQLEEARPDVRAAHVIQVADVPVSKQHLCDGNASSVCVAMEQQ